MTKHYAVQTCMITGDARKMKVKTVRSKPLKAISPPAGFKLTDEQAEWMAQWYPMTFLVGSGLYNQ